MPGAIGEGYEGQHHRHPHQNPYHRCQRGSGIEAKEGDGNGDRQRLKYRGK